MGKVMSIGEPELLERIEVGDVVQTRAGGPRCNVLEVKPGSDLQSVLAVLSFADDGTPQMWAAPRVVFEKVKTQAVG